MTLSDVLLALGIVLLLFEVIKGARPGAKYLTDHLLSLIVFGAAAAEFVLLPQFGTSTYFLLTLLALVDVLSGIALRARRGTQARVSRRSVAAGARDGLLQRPNRNSIRRPAPAPRLRPKPCRTDRAEPKIVHPEAHADGGHRRRCRRRGCSPATARRRRRTRRRVNVYSARFVQVICRSPDSPRRTAPGAA